MNAKGLPLSKMKKGEEFQNKIKYIKYNEKMRSTQKLSIDISGQHLSNY